MPSRLLVVVVAGVAAVLASCDDGGASSSSGGGCSPPVRERLDAASGVHLLPGAAEPEYLSDPPTSGPHLSGRPPTGVVDQPLDRPTQVLVLEEGGIVIQHRDLDPEEVATLEALAGDQVVVAPGGDLPQPVVATAWTAKLTCDDIDVDAVRRFVEDRRGQGPPGGEAPPA